MSSIMLFWVLSRQVTRNIPHSLEFTTVTILY